MTGTFRLRGAVVAFATVLAMALGCGGNGGHDGSPAGGQGGGGGGSGGPGAAGNTGVGGVGGGTPDGAAGAAGRDGDATPDATTPDTTVSDGSGFDGMIIGEETTCHDLANTAPYVTPQRLPTGAVPPTLTGGALVDGRYELVSVDKYPSGDSRLQATYRRTLALSMSGAKLLMVDLASLNPGNPSETGYRVVRPSFAVTSTPDGMFTTMSDACASSTSTTQYRYQVGPSTLTLWNPTAGTLQSYARVP